MKSKPRASTPQPCWLAWFGKGRLAGISGLALAMACGGAGAQSVWTYEVIGPDNKANVSFKPPKDISYPPAGQPASVYDPKAKQGTVLTPQEAAARLRAPMLVIVLGPAY